MKKSLIMFALLIILGFLIENGIAKEAKRNTDFTVINSSSLPLKKESTIKTNKSPIITLKGENPYVYTLPGAYPVCDTPDDCPRGNVGYKEPGYIAIDPEDGNITSKVVVTTVYPPDPVDGGPICKQYSKIYTVKDSGGKTTKMERKVEECMGA